MVRQRFAKPLYAGSNPVLASNPRCFLDWVPSPGHLWPKPRRNIKRQPRALIEFLKGARVRLYFATI